MPSRTAPIDRTTNLVAERTAFIGRTTELAAIDTRFTEGARLVTITGPGGSGKTRLARRHAGIHLGTEAFPGGVWFCDLTDARDRDQVEASVSQVLEARLDGTAASARESGGGLGRAIDARGPLLLVLDNAEQAVAAVAMAVADWLDRAPSARFLVTSRERLRLSGECVVDIGPLGMPNPSERDPAAIRASESVTLFCDRARAVRANFRLGDDETVLLSEIVRRLDGMPLAIELCAARAVTLGIRDLSNRLSRRFDLLAGDARDLTARHRTLRAVLDWSWDLLDPPERSALAQCSVFRDGFSLDAAARVIELAGDDASGSAATAAVHALVERSLVVTENGSAPPGEIRYRLYESIRDYACEHLTDGEAVNERHTRWFLTSASDLADRVHGPGGVEALQRLALESGNLTAVYERAMARASAEPPMSTNALRALLCLEPVFVTRGPIDRYVAMLDAALAASDTAAPALVARALLSRGAADRRSERRRDLERAVELATEAGDSTTRIFAAIRLGWNRAAEGRFDEAAACFESAREGLDDASAPRLQALFDRHYGHYLARRGRGAEALGYYRRALAAFETTGGQRDVGLVLVLMGYRHLDDGALADARARFEGAIEVLSNVDDRRLLASGISGLGATAQDAGDRDEARTRYERALSLVRTMADAHLEGVVRARLGSLALEEGRYVAALAAYGEAAELVEEAGDVATASLYRAAGSFAAARAGRSARANELRSDAGVVDPGRDKHPALALFRGGCALALAGAGASPEREAAARLLAQAEAGPSDREGAHSSAEGRVALRLLRRALEPAADGSSSGSATTSTAEGESAKREREPLRVGPDGRWVRLPGEHDPVDLRRSGAPRRILLDLVRRRLSTPGAGASIHDVVNAGWPGERFEVQAGYNRAYSAIRTLRRLGLDALLLTRDDGYLLDPEVPVAWEPDTPTD